MSKEKELEIGGISFGLTSGVMATIGMIIGLDSATSGSKLAIIAAIMTIAVADSLSDAFGIGLSEESRLDEKKKPIWAIALFTFLGKFFFSMFFVLPLVLLPTERAIGVSVSIGFLFLILLAIFIAKRRKQSAFNLVLRNIGLSVLIIAACYMIGKVADKLS